MSKVMEAKVFKPSPLDGFQPRLLGEVRFSSFVGKDQVRIQPSDFPEVAKQLAAELSPEDAELLYVLRQVGGIAPRRWFRLR